MLHKQRIRSRQPEEKIWKSSKIYLAKWNILKIPWKVYEIRKQLDVSFIILMLIRGLSWKNWEERAIKGSRGAIVFYNNNQPSHLLEMDYKIWPNIQQRREAKKGGKREDSRVNMKATFAVMNTTWAVVKIRPEKNSGLYGVTITFSKSGRRYCNGQLRCNINPKRENVLAG